MRDRTRHRAGDRRGEDQQLASRRSVASADPRRVEVRGAAGGVLQLQRTAGNVATSALLRRPARAASHGTVVSRELTTEEREEIEGRTGPLARPVAGPAQVAVPEATRADMQNDFEKDLETWRAAAQTAVGDFVRDHDREASYDALALALLAAPLGPLGVGLTGAAALTHAVASASISVIGTVPTADDGIGQFRDSMRDAYDRVAANRENSSSTILHNWILGLTPALAADPERMRRRFTADCFTYVTGSAVDASQTRERVEARLTAEWDRLERARREREAERFDGIGGAAWGGA